MAKDLYQILPLARRLDTMDLSIKPRPKSLSKRKPAAPTVYPEHARAFLFAAALRDFARIRHFIEVVGLHPDTTLEGKPTAICYAVLKQDNCLLSYLHKRGASINIADRIGMTPLHYAALGGSAYCVAYLVRNGANLNQRNKAGETPSSMIQGRPDLDECRELLRRYGADQESGNTNRRLFH